MMKGYDLEIVEQVRNAISVPMSVVGGAGSLADIGQLINKFGIIGAVAGSLFVFKGVYKAVLINYPGRPEKEKILIDNFHI
jgi:cyclase